ncbi:MAG: HEAT repeat domain-containing protein [Bacteroidia bacterium]
MFKRKKLSDIYSEYLVTNENLFEKQDMLEKFWTGSKTYKTENLQFLEAAVTDKDTQKLKFSIAMAFRDGLDKDYSDIFYKLILETWHEEHEDIVEIVFDFKEERYCEALLKIAMEDKIYRKFDDENESTLRKCVNALVAINTKKSKDILEKLILTKNPNVRYALET